LIVLWTLFSRSLHHSLKTTLSVVCPFIVTFLLRYSGYDMHTDVVNGEINKLLLAIENKTGKNVTLLTVAGEFLDPATEQLIKPVRALP
jgi:hypothetical protein